MNEEAWQQIASSGQPYHGGDIYNNGINTTRGRAVEAMARLIGKDAAYIQRFGTTLDELACEPRPSVASCVARALRTVAYHDAERGLSLFQRMDFSEERLLGTHHVYEFMRENMWHGFAKLEDWSCGRFDLRTRMYARPERGWRVWPLSITTTHDT